MAKITFSPSSDGIEKGINFIENTLAKYKIKKESIQNALIISTDALKKLSDNASENTNIEISVFHWYRTATITMSAQGKDFNYKYTCDDVPVDKANNGEALKALVSDNKNVSYSHFGETNYIRIKIGALEQTFAYRTLFSFLFALIVAFLLQFFLPSSASKALSENVLMPIQTIFLNSLKLVTAPAVFFSLMLCVARYASMTDTNSINIKITIKYVVSAAFAVIVGITLFNLFNPAAGLEGSMSVFVDKSNATSNNTITKMIVDMVPDNIISPFLNTNSMQLLVVAILFGIALGKAGKYSSFLRIFTGTLNKFFNAAVDIITNLIPLGVFFVTILTVMTFGPGSLIPTIKVFLLTMLGFLIVIIAYMLYILIVGRLNPLTFLKKYKSSIRKTFIAGSGVNAIPESMRCCKNRLGISPKIYSFTIPFGAISNLDGNCIYLTIAGLTIATLCGADLFGTDLVTAIFLIVILSVGSPITPASAILAITMLMGQFGVSMQAISLVLGINAFIEVVLATSNTLCDVATALVAAKTEGLLDTETFNVDKL